MPNDTEHGSFKNSSETRDNSTVTCPRCGRPVERIVGTQDGDRVEPCGHSVDLVFRTARDLRDRVEARRDRQRREREALK